MTSIYVLLGSLPTLHCMPKNCDIRDGNGDYEYSSWIENIWGNGRCYQLDLGFFPGIPLGNAHGLGRPSSTIAVENISGCGKGEQSVTEFLTKPVNEFQTPVSIYPFWGLP